MNENLKQDLKQLECVGNVAHLPKTPLNDYAGLKKMLTKANGKYKKNTFEFPYPAQAIINRLLSGEVIDFKKEFQFFPTPPEMCEILVNQVLWNKENMEILEPSAGHGALIDEILKRQPGANIDAVELSHLNFEVLLDKYKKENMTITQGDFLDLRFSKKYDLIVANPPFSKNQDIDHVKKMYELLNEGGQLISIMSTSWTFGQQKKQIEFREWIEENGMYIENGQGSFKTSGTMVNTVLVTITK